MKIKTLINFFLLSSLVCLSQGTDIDTSSLGAAGVKIYCSTSSIGFGYDVKAIGDINGDRISEFVIGIPNYNGNQGMVAIVYGSPGSSLTTFDVCTNSDDSKGYTITGEAGKPSRFGSSVNEAGDINGDGIPDIVVGAPQYSGGGRAYIIFLNKQKILTTIFTSPLPTEGFILTITSSSGGQLGFTLDGGKDINKDGIPDVLISAVSYASSKGRAYIFYGTGTNNGTTLNLDTAPSNVGYSIEGVTISSNFAGSLAMCEDLNNDKISDFVVGNVGEQAIYVIYGTDGKTRSSQTTKSIINNGNGFKISGNTLKHGYQVRCGDINGDKVPDLAVASTLKTLSRKGRVDVVFGATADSVSSFDTMNTPMKGFRITDSALLGYLGQRIDISKDINGDLIADLIIAAPDDDSGKGVVYVLFGSKTALDNIDAHDISPQSKGFKITGSTTSSYLGDAIASNMDLNCDGIADILVSSVTDSAVYLIYGTGTSTKYMTNGVCKSLTFLLFNS